MYTYWGSSSFKRYVWVKIICTIQRKRNPERKAGLSERFTDKETSMVLITLPAEVTRSANESVARWDAIYQFCRGSGRYRYKVSERQGQAFDGVQDHTRLQSEQDKEWSKC